MKYHIINNIFKPIKFFVAYYTELSTVVYIRPGARTVTLGIHGEKHE